MKTAHIVVDMLYDFIDGTLATLNAEQAVKKDIDYINDNSNQEILYIADAHPYNHCSFKEYGGIWPPHCIKESRGGEIHQSYHKEIKEPQSRPASHNILRKGENPNEEQYSGYEAKNEEGKSLNDLLKKSKIEHVIMSGIATEYCIKQTALDLLKGGYKVTLLKEALGYITNDGHLETIEELKEQGVKLE